MPAARRPSNRGPAAAAENRAAILASARRLFAERGYRVPLSAIAREAGVGQGVLYRHFPSRRHLAYAVFADNFADLERLASADSSAQCFGRLWRRLVEFTVDSTAFVDLVIAEHTDLPTDVDSPRLERLFAGPLARAQRAGLADASWTTADVLVLLQMVYGVIVAQPDRRHPLAAVRRALELVDPRLADVLRDQIGDGSYSVPLVPSGAE